MYSLFLFLLLINSIPVLGQCPNGQDINSLFGQAGVDAFLAANPTCTYIEELELNGDVTDISGFATVKSMGYFYINNCELLSDLNGLHNVDSIFGNLGIEGSQSLKDLSALQIKFIGQDLRIEETTGLITLKGLDQLTTITDDIEIVDNTSLACLTGLEGVISTGDDLRIQNNTSLVDCCGVKDLVSNGGVGGDVEIANNPFSCNSLQELLDDPCQDVEPICSTVSVIESAEEEQSLSVFPNPVGTLINIINNEKVKINEIVVYNQIGQKIKQINSPGNTIDVEDLSGGTYIVLFKTNEKTITRKILVY